MAPCKGHEVMLGAWPGVKKRKGGAEAPPPCAMSSLTPVRDDPLGAARPCGLWITRSASWLPIKRRREPGFSPYLASCCSDGVPTLRVGSTDRQLSLRREKPFRRHLTAFRRSRQAVASRACQPFHLQPPMAWATLGLPCPV